MEPFFWPHMPHQLLPQFSSFCKTSQKFSHILSLIVILLKPLRMRLLPKPPPPGSSTLLNSMVNSRSLFFFWSNIWHTSPNPSYSFWTQHSDQPEFLLVFWLPHWTLILGLLCWFFLFTSISCYWRSLGSCPPGFPFLSPLSISPIWVLYINF